MKSLPIIRKVGVPYLGKVNREDLANIAMMPKDIDVARTTHTNPKDGAE